MKYQSKSFSVPVGQRKECESHWWDVRNKCVFCGVGGPNLSVTFTHGPNGELYRHKVYTEDGHLREVVVEELK